MLPFASLTERADWLMRLAVPCTFMVLLFLLNVSAITFPVIGQVKASLFLMAVYYWAIYRPTLVPLWMLFVAGCFMDLLGGTPLGFNALIFVLTQWVIYGQRRFLTGQPFIVLWVGFAAVCMASLFIQWGIMGLTHMRWSGTKVLWISGVFSVALFPVVCIILHLTHKILPAPRQVARFRAKG